MLLFSDNIRRKMYMVHARVQRQMIMLHAAGNSDLIQGQAWFPFPFNSHYPSDGLPGCVFSKSIFYGLSADLYHEILSLSKTLKSHFPQPLQAWKQTVWILKYLVGKKTKRRINKLIKESWQRRGWGVGGMGLAREGGSTFEERGGPELYMNIRDLAGQLHGWRHKVHGLLQTYTNMWSWTFQDRKMLNMTPKLTPFMTSLSICMYQPSYLFSLGEAKTWPGAGRGWCTQKVLYQGSRIFAIHPPPPPQVFNPLGPIWTALSLRNPMQREVTMSKDPGIQL